MERNLESLTAFGAEGWLIAILMVVLIVDLRGVSRKRPSGTRLWTLFGLLGAVGLTIAQGAAGTRPDLFWGLLASDPFAVFFKILVLVCAVVLVLMCAWSRQVDRRAEAELHALTLAITLGLMLMASATDLLTIYLAVELVSVLSYIVAGLQPREPRAREAALKYVVYGGAASGVMLYGMSFLFGATGATNLVEIREGLAASGAGFAALVGLALVLGGLAYKVAAVPFHMWAPDVYEGAPIPVTAFFSVAPKAAGFAVLLRIFATFFGPGGVSGELAEAAGALVATMAIATMVVGNFGALHQTNLKRFLAYSSVAHAGYALMGVALVTGLGDNALALEGVGAVLLYMAMYVFMNLGAFLVASEMIDATGREDIEAFRGYGLRNTLAAVSMAIFLFSLAGLPPLAGFVGKFYLFAAVLGVPTTLNVVMVVIAALTSVVAAYYYFRVVRAMFLDSVAAPVFQPMRAAPRALLIVLLVATVGLGLYWAPMLEAARGGSNISGIGMSAVEVAAAPSQPAALLK